VVEPELSTGMKVWLHFLLSSLAVFALAVPATAKVPCSILPGTACMARGTNRFLYDGWNLVAELGASPGNTKWTAPNNVVKY